MGAQDGQPAMQIVTRWLVTNITDQPAILANATLSRGWFNRRHEAVYIPKAPVNAGTTVEVQFQFWTSPPFREKGESFQARLTIFDHLGNPHRTQRISIPSNWRPRQKEAKPPEEAMHSIGDPIVKQIVAILKDEVNRYKECGRSVGGLGSVQVTYENLTSRGIGRQLREANSPRRQWIIPDTRAASIDSDNVDALASLFLKQDDAGQQTIIAALLERIELGNEYTSIGYFFLFSLFRMGQLPAALRTINDRLIADRKLGFDDAVQMLSGLIQYEHSSFSDPMLDEVERFMDGLDGYIYHLKERCIAARAIRHEN